MEMLLETQDARIKQATTRGVIWDITVGKNKDKMGKAKAMEGKTPMLTTTTVEMQREEQSKNMTSNLKQKIISKNHVINDFLNRVFIFRHHA